MVNLEDFTVIATVRAEGAGAASVDAREMAFLPRGPLSLETFQPFAAQLTERQLFEIFAGVSELRRAFSSELIAPMIVRRVDEATCARTDFGSEATRARLAAGGAVTSFAAQLDFRGRQAPGRPDAAPIDTAFKTAFAQAVARFDRLGAVIEPCDIETFKAERRALGSRLEDHGALFNLNADHAREDRFPVRGWCQTHGPRLLAEAYGLEERALEAALDRAFIARIRARGFAEVLAGELGLIDTLCLWHEAHKVRKKAEIGVRDSARRVIKKLTKDRQAPIWLPEPPRLYSSVRQRLVAEKALAELGPERMIAAASLFDLAPAFGVFLTRIYLLPLLESAALAGSMALRGRPGTIASLVVAGGLVGLGERARTNAEQDPVFQSEVEGLQTGIEALFARASLSVAQLAGHGRAVLETGVPVTIPAREGAPRFFLND
ncbi:hypothetical protein [Pelagibacterium montanilacus]|uniref:hypothetical protein n=1 Tax=Pelagibacterium montanilacus TaxID=2185280 RepID=UPI000F8F63CE|nr:hypothetical protein [Pelagibacterium montanilacus]